MIGLDCNILVQLAFADHPANAKTVAAVQAEIGRGGPDFTEARRLVEEALSQTLTHQRPCLTIRAGIYYAGITRTVGWF